jgi:GT2 family glycosyltransferase
MEYQIINSQVYMMSPKQEPLLSVIITTYKSHKTLRECLVSLFASNFPINNIEVIVVDHGLEDDTREVVKNFPVKYISQIDPGLAKARNSGVLAAKGSIIVFVDDDVSVPINWLYKIKTAFDQDNELYCLGGPDIYFRSDSYFGKCINIQENFFKKHLFVLKEKNLRLKGCNMAFRKEVFTTIGLFETKRVYYHREDANFISRVKNSGMKIRYDKTIYLYHHTPTMKKFIKKNIISHKESHETFGKTYFVHYLAFIALAIVFISMLIYTPIIYALIFLVLSSFFLLGIIVCNKMDQNIFYSPGISIILLINLFFIYTKAIYSIWIKMSKPGDL